MSTSSLPDVRAGRLTAAQYAHNFAEATPRFSAAKAVLEAERCLYCFDAPCATACPTHIDVPSFIKRIADGNVRGAAQTILEANPLGGMCARVCPTENLCEGVCVRNTQSGEPIAIGRLQRFAVDALMHSSKPQIFARAASTGKKVAVVGAGPAGLACAHSLAKLGHQVALFDAQPQAGGLNEYGLASYKTPGTFAQDEIKWLLSVGGIELCLNYTLESAAQLESLCSTYDAVFLGMGLASTHRLDVPGHDLQGVQDAVRFIATLRQTPDKSTLPVGQRVVVIGGGMTAVDAAVQAKLLGAQDVHIVYRRGAEQMSASRDEQVWAQTNGVVIHHWLAPVEVLPCGPAATQHVGAVRFARQTLQNDKLVAMAEFQTLPADMVLLAIGQTLGNPVLAQAGLALQGGRMVTDAQGKTNLSKVWAGGDCRAGGLELTVEAVAQGMASAQAIHTELSGSVSA